MTTHSEVVAKAREWLGTPFQHQQRTKGLAVDCAGLLIGVARELQLVEADFDVGGYARQPDGVSLLRSCDQYMTRLQRDQLRPGHVIVVSYDAHPGHIGILGDYAHGGLSMIHAAMKSGRVIETRLMFSSHMRFAAAYNLLGVE
jgi:cell wall-associated NlpC family hydrolase